MRGPLQQRLQAISGPDPRQQLAEAIDSLVDDGLERLLGLEEHLHILRRDLYAIRAKLQGDLY